MPSPVPKATPILVFIEANFYSLSRRATTFENYFVLCDVEVKSFTSSTVESLAYLS
jgi:hypothetical protein